MPATRAIGHTFSMTPQALASSLVHIRNLEGAPSAASNHIERRSIAAESACGSGLNERFTNSGLGRSPPLVSTAGPPASSSATGFSTLKVCRAPPARSPAPLTEEARAASPSSDCLGDLEPRRPASEAPGAPPLPVLPLTEGLPAPPPSPGPSCRTPSSIPPRGTPPCSRRRYVGLSG